MAEEKVTALDSEFLKNFIRDDIVEFKDGLERMTKDSEEGRSMYTLSAGDVDMMIDSPAPLFMGQMDNQAAGLNGGELNKLVRASAEKIHKLLKEHGVLFEDIEDALNETIKELKKTQGGNLAGISADDFVEIFDDVDDDFTGGGGGVSKEEDD